MKNLRRNFESFCYRNRNKGIPNLMLYIVIGCGFVSLLTSLGYTDIYMALCFDKQLILQGQIWRLVTYIFTLGSGNMLMTLIVLYCTYSLGRAVESSWGSMKFTLYYLVTILMMDIFAMIFDGHVLLYEWSSQTMTVGSGSVTVRYWMAEFLHLSLILCYATMNPDNMFVIFFVIPIRARFLSLIYLAYSLYQVIALTVPVVFLPHNLFPLVGLLSYFLFFGRDVLDLLPLSWRVKKRKPRKKSVHTGPMEFQPAQHSAKAEVYSHKCAVCGRTDVTNPELEFRYCSRCSGYHCYCQDHINNHTHIE